MLLGLISDSHDNISAVKSAIGYFRERNIRVVLHLGDIISPFTLKLFRDFEFYGIFGNNDGEKLLLKKIALDNDIVLEEGPLELNLGGKNFVLMHGWGSIDRTVRLVSSFAESGQYDYILYGHTHKLDVRKIDSSVIINPGESCGYLTGRKTVAVLDLDAGTVEIVDI